jgi:hypothetical protein
MAASGLIYALMVDGSVVWLRVRNGDVVDAPDYIKRRIVGGCPRQAWIELARQAARMEWIPDDRRQQHVRHVPQRARVRGAVLDRLRRAHERTPRTAAA